eukprot:scaffold63_cov306-Pinguiococcus_pyrenoidosus.AAC.77
MKDPVFKDASLHCTSLHFTTVISFAFGLHGSSRCRWESHPCCGRRACNHRSCRSSIAKHEAYLEAILKVAADHELYRLFPQHRRSDLKITGQAGNKSVHGLGERPG